MISIDNTTDCTLDTPMLEAIADALTQREIELVICDDATIAELNRTHRQIDAPTDVLSFPLAGEHDHMPLGTVVIACDHARRKADELGHTPDAEIALLFIHGLLHLLGYDHETDTGQMREREHALIRMFELPESLIVRTEERP
jgi:probable rRNA maturation factor